MREHTAKRLPYAGSLVTFLPAQESYPPEGPALTNLQKSHNHNHTGGRFTHVTLDKIAAPTFAIETER